MPDVSLPPVGELVQIATARGAELAEFNGTWFRHLDGSTTDPRFVQSWCRVLVLPDTEETAERMAQAFVDQTYSSNHQWRTLSGKTRDMHRRNMSAVLAAVRGAAIR